MKLHVKNSAKYLSLIGFVGLAGACNGGDRANGGCPDDEVCSPSTPNGLYFETYGHAKRLLDSGPELTAIGGFQTVTIAESGRPFTRVFRIDTGNAIRATQGAGATIRIEGAAPGSTYLRIIDEDGKLFDRISIGAAALKSISLVPVDEEIAGPFVSLPGAELAVQLKDANDRILVDEGTAIAGSGFVKGSHWDRLDIAQTAAANVEISVTAANLPPAALTAKVVTSVTEVQPLAVPTSLEVNAGGRVCFAALAGAERVAGAKWSFTVDNKPVLPSLFERNCVGVTASQPGSVRVSATVLGKSATVTIPAVAKPSQLTSDGFEFGPAGERAMAMTAETY